MANQYPIQVEPSPQVKETALKLRKNCWPKSLALNVIIVMPLATAPKCVHRKLLRLQQYDVKIGYKPGPEMHLADTLSRAYLLTTARSPAERDRMDPCS